MKLFDFDALFEKKLSEYISKAPARYDAEGWERAIPKLYDRFGDTPIPAVGCTPREFYARMTPAELVEALVSHREQGVAVSDFLLRALEERARKEDLLPLLAREDDLAVTAASLIGPDERAFPAYLSMLERGAGVQNAAMEQLLAGAEQAKPLILAALKEGKCREHLLELLAHTAAGDDEVLDILLRDLRESGEEAAAADRLAAYGDERALPALNELIVREDIGYLAYRELKYAIEALGGEPCERDFSESTDYLDFVQRQAETLEAAEKKKDE